MSPSRIEDRATCLTLRQYSTGTVLKSWLAHSLYTPSFLDALAKLRKATITFVTSVRPPVRLHMLPDLTLNFKCNFFSNDLIFYLTVRVIARCVRQHDKTNRQTPSFYRLSGSTRQSTQISFVRCLITLHSP
jgi:hypothetical protein